MKNDAGGSRQGDDPVGKASQSQTLDLSEDVRDLGRKARARLEQQKSQRREIVRVDVQPQKLPATNRQTVLSFEEERKKVNARTAKRRRSSNSQQQNKINDRNVDRWMPDISHIVPPDSKQNRSNVVQLHGLPVGTTAAQIRRFFSGLDPQRVLLLLSFSPVLSDWDSRHERTLRKRGLRVDRYNSNFRVLVKFYATPTATLAVQRSGEVLPLDDSRGVAVAVTQCTKMNASYMVKKLAIDAILDRPLETGLYEIESKLDSVVPSILWTAALKDLKLQTEGTHRPLFPLNMRGLKLLRPIPKDSTERLLDHRTRLFQQIERLSNQRPFPAAEPLNPALLSVDPALHLTSNCVDILRREMERIDAALIISDRWSFFAPSSTAPQASSCG